MTPPPYVNEHLRKILKHKIEVEEIHVECYIFHFSMTICIEIIRGVPFFLSDCTYLYVFMYFAFSFVKNDFRSCKEIFQSNFLHFFSYLISTVNTLAEIRLQDGFSFPRVFKNVVIN